MNKGSNKQGPGKGKVFHGAITIFYKRTNQDLLFLVVENSKTGNLSFVSGAKADVDQSIEDSARRENLEELGLSFNQYELRGIDVKHEFMFGPKKKERAGHKGEYQVFVSDLTNADFEISHTKELKSAKWMTEKEVLDSLTFPDLVEVFKKTVKVINSNNENSIL
jgi:NADH pyrophosphatase NudC (nudix superfamily)